VRSLPALPVHPDAHLDVHLDEPHLTEVQPCQLALAKWSGYHGEIVVLWTPQDLGAPDRHRLHDFLNRVWNLQAAL
jgi:hypothetical protein